MSDFPAFALLLAVLSFLPYSDSIAQEGGSGTPTSELGFPRHILFEYNAQDLPFVLIGEAERSFLFFDIYDVAYYQSNSIDPGSELEFLYLVYERDLAKEKVHGALRQGVKSNLKPSEWDEILLELEALLLSIDHDVSAGDTLKILKISNSKIAFFYNGQSIASFNNVLLVSALWAIWLGENSVVDRDSLTGNLL